MIASRYPILVLLGLLLAVHLLTGRHSEPYFNNDEIRHTMTGVFVRDALHDLPASAKNPRDYAVNYYVQYPALGLLTWPPFFYFVEGLAMFVCGPSFVVARLCVAFFAVLVVLYGYGFARLHFETRPALLATALFALTPYVFLYSQHVMLEIPALALVLGSMLHFEWYLRQPRWRDALLACLLAALGLLTRFDAVFLLPYFGLRLLGTGNLRRVLDRPVLVGFALTVLLVLPYYLLTLREYGGGLQRAATSGPAETATGFELTRNLPYYLLELPHLIGYPLSVVAVLGLGFTLRAGCRGFGPALSILAAVYLTFTPLAELETRHSIYWSLGWAILATRFVLAILNRFPRDGRIVLILLILGSGVELGRQQYRYVFGYEAAAKWMLTHRQTDRPILADGELSGSIVFHTRLNDPTRSVTVLRGDKLLYAMFSDPKLNYTSFAENSADVLRILHDYDPEFVVIEDPAPQFRDDAVRGVVLLAQTLREHPEAYQRETVIPLTTNYDNYEGVSLIVYRKRIRNPSPISSVSIPVLGLGRTVGPGR